MIHTERLRGKISRIGWRTQVSEVELWRPVQLRHLACTRKRPYVFVCACVLINVSVLIVSLMLSLLTFLGRSLPATIWSISFRAVLTICGSAGFTSQLKQTDFSWIYSWLPMFASLGCGAAKDEPICGSGLERLFAFWMKSLCAGPTITKAAP